MKKAIILSVVLVFATGCNKVYYNTMEKFGSPKRDILVERVEGTRDSQQIAKAQFTSALEKFKYIVDVNSGLLEEKYELFKDELKKSESQANNLYKQIDSVEDVANALFEEWENELSQYSSADLRAASRAQLDQTKQKYAQMIGAMQKAQGKMESVLAVFRDQVLFLKHNLNAQAITSIKGKFGSMEKEMNQLVAEMNKSIAEADSFIKAMKE
ncbi:MAG: DUF2959 domain-containing protein [Phycisphaerae bacterium]|jgi:SMC interacting uncharacterized protein involved in chromosome segregation